MRIGKRGRVIYCYLYWHDHWRLMTVNSSVVPQSPLLHPSLPHPPPRNHFLHPLLQHWFFIRENAPVSYRFTTVLRLSLQDPTVPWTLQSLCSRGISAAPTSLEMRYTVIREYRLTTPFRTLNEWKIRTLSLITLIDRHVLRDRETHVHLNHLVYVYLLITEAYIG